MNDAVTKTQSDMYTGTHILRSCMSNETGFLI